MDFEVLMGLGSSGNPQAQQRAMQYFDQLKVSEDGWKLCANALTTGQNLNDHMRFFCFQVVEYYLKTGYKTSNITDHNSIKAFLLGWLELQCVGPNRDKSFIRNKAAQMFSLACTADYPHRWPSFFNDLLQTLHMGETAVDIYLRILKAIDSEVVDREIAHTQEESVRNTAIKDYMRGDCVPRLVDSWYSIITNYERSNPELTCKCLDVVGAYVSWIEITLVANDKFVSVILRFMSNQLLRESACDCIHEIIQKGMDPMAKLKLIESFMSVLQSAGVFAVSDDEDGDYLAKLSKLVNGIGLQLIAGYQKYVPRITSNNRFLQNNSLADPSILVKIKEEENSKILFDALLNKIPLMLKFLGNDDDDVSGAVGKFAHDWITLLKTLSPLNDTLKQSVKQLLYTVIRKMKYDDSYCFESEGEEEAMFEEYRKELKIIFNNMGALDSDLVLSTIHEYLAQALGQWQTAEFQDVEVAICMLYQLAEALPNYHNLTLAGDTSKVPCWQHLMRLLVTSGVSNHPHSSVSMQFFETVVRYDKFFNQEPQYIPDTLMAFLDERGLRNRAKHVSSRTAYLFTRFVKDIGKSHLQSYLEDILKRLHDLLILNTPDNGTRLVQLSNEDQLFVYETAGILVVQSQFEPEKKLELMRQLLAPIVTKFDPLLQAMAASNHPPTQQSYAECLTNAMSFASRTSKGFSSSNTMKSCGCVAVYTDTLQVFLRALETPVHRPMLHAGVRQYLHRMVVCLDNEILPFVPVAMESLMKHADAKELYDFIPLINQLVCKFKKQIIPFLQSVFLPVVTKIFQVLNLPVDERDQDAASDKRLLQRSYFSFIATLVNNNVHEVLSNQERSNLQQVLLTIIQGAVDLPDPTGQKICFSILKKLIELWGGKDGLVGFRDFMYESIVPACFMAPLKPTFDLGDAQTILALNECAACLKMAEEKRGEELLAYLQSTYLPAQNVEPELAQQFCRALKSDSKVFRSYFKSFYTKAKS